MNTVKVIMYAGLVLMLMHSGVAKREVLSAWPPWKGERSPATSTGVVFTVPEVDNMPDFHGNPVGARLVILAGGNYFFALDELVEAFEAVIPAVKGRVFYETIPPGIVVKQLENGGTITVGNFTFSVQADVVQVGSERIHALIQKGLLAGPPITFATNTLAIMVGKGNPTGIQSLQDLAKPGIRLANPNPQTEGIAKQIKEALRKAGGEELVTSIYQSKLENGQATLTEIHHRQTPLWIMQGKVDAGVTWVSEPRHQEMIGHPITSLAIPDKHNVHGSQAAAMVTQAANRQEAKAWLDFLQSPTAQQILQKYGMEIPDPNHR